MKIWTRIIGAVAKRGLGEKGEVECTLIYRCEQEYAKTKILHRHPDRRAQATKRAIDKHHIAAMRAGDVARDR